MTQYVINIGAIPNDGTGDPLRTAFNETNLNFDQVFAAGPVLSNIQIANNKISTTNTNGNLILAPNGTGIVQSNVSILPNLANIRNLGATDRRWNTVYSQYVNATQIAVAGDLTVSGNLTVVGNTIQIGNITTETLTIQLANAASTANAANGAGVTVGANDNIATLLYDSGNNTWDTNIGLAVNGAITGTSLAVSDATIYGNIASINGNFTGNVTANYFIGNGSLLTGITSYANANAVAYGESGWAGNIIPAANVTYSLGNSTNWWSNVWVAGNTIYIGGVPVGMTAGNVLTVGGNAVLQNDSNTTISTTGNITADYFFGNGSQLTGIETSRIFNGTSNVEIATANGNITVTANGSSSWTFDTTGNLITPANLVVGPGPAGGSSILQYDSALQVVGEGANAIMVMGWAANTNAPDSIAVVGFNTPYTNGASNVQIAVGNNATVVNYWTFDTAGNLTLPQGGTVSEQANPDGFPGHAIVLTPTTVIDPTQQLWVYPTGGSDYNHLHLTSGNLYNTELFLGNDNLYVKLANSGNIIINSNDNAGNTAQWTFGADGNLTLPGNIIAINYADGNRVTGGVTFSGEAVIGTGTSNTQSGLYLAPDPVSLTNDLYLRVRGNIYDEPTHIHFDTGNNQYYNQFIGDDNKYIQLANTGNIVVNTNDNAGNSAQWTFGTNGNLTAPGNITANTFISTAYNVVTAGNLSITSQYGFGVTGTILENGGTLELIGNGTGFGTTGCVVVGWNSSYGAGLGPVAQMYFNPPGSSGNAVLTTGNLAATSYEWKFDDTGNLTLPGNVFAVNYANGTPVSLGGTYGNADVANLLASFGNNSISTTGNVSSDNLVATGNANVLTLTTRNGDSNNSNASPQIIMGYAGTADYPSFIHTTHNAGTPVDNTIEFWTCDGSQFGTFPANAVLGLTVTNGNIETGGILTDNYYYANGTPVSFGGSSYGNANVATFLASYGSNTVVTTGNITGGNIIATANVLANGYARLTGTFDESQASTAGLYLGYAGGTPRIMFGTGNTSQTLEIDNDGGTLRFYKPGTTLASLTSAGDFSVAGNISGNTAGYAIGYRDIPQVTFNANATAALADAGKHYYSTTAGNLALTLPDNSNVAFATGTALTIVVNAAGNVLVNQGTGVSLYQAGTPTTGNRVVGAYGMATVMKVAANTWVISGTGVY